MNIIGVREHLFMKNKENSIRIKLNIKKIFDNFIIIGTKILLLFSINLDTWKLYSFFFELLEKKFDLIFKIDSSSINNFID
jgi:hypothetical protein